MPEYVTPTIKPKTPINKELLIRLYRMIMSEDIQHPDIPRYKLTNHDLLAKVVVLQSGGSDIFRTFLHKEFFPASVVDSLAVGDRVICSVPDAELSQGRFDVDAVVTAIDPPLMVSWVSEELRNGVTPRALSQTNVTFDIECSVLAALEIGGVVWRWPNVGKILPDTDFGPSGDVFSALHEMTRQLPVAVHSGSASNQDLLRACYVDLEEFLKKAATSMPDIRSIMYLLPLGTIVTCTSTKSIAEWRSWLMVRSECPEAAWIRANLYKHLANNALGPLFVGCEAVVDMLQLFQAE